MEARHDHDELKDAPTLRSISKVDPFVVPDGFFERFPQQVQARINKPESRTVALWRWITDAPVALRLAGVATVLALIAGGIYFNMPEDERIASQPGEITVDPSEIDADDYDAGELFSEIDAHGLMAEATDLSTEEMEVYLENEELPLDLLIEEL